MDLRRRDFFKVMCATGLSLAIGKELNASSVIKNSSEFYGILYDSSRCKGCRGCEYDCADANGLPEPIPTKDIKGLRKPDETRRTVINEYHTSKGIVYSKMQCMHCNEPACAAACLTEAMHKTLAGPVVWNGDKCMGCRYCMVSCPFDMPKFEYHSSNPKIQKCTMCFDTRVQKGELPACVENCPNEALTFGTRKELIQEARRRIYENPDQYVDHIYGEHEAGGTCWLALSPVPFEELGMNTSLQKTSYPSLTKGFLYSVPSVFVLVPALLLGIQQATKKNHTNPENDDE
ncbi:MAG: 4Fe-4S dicluster domain-containing protein [Lentimicrobium sp.]|nr:4Fe-4S dicluster domain-containing protein [Lentimicrobium sp.]